MPADPVPLLPAPIALPAPAVTVLSLGDGFWDEVAPATFPAQVLRFRNQRAAAEIGLDGLSDDAWLRAMARFQPLPDNLPSPLALRYHGHQFTNYNPHLGDGRGFLYAQFRAAVPPASVIAGAPEGSAVPGALRLLDLGTKGSGTTPWSRGGDGRLTLKGGFREILAAEMLEAFGVPTCRILSVVETGEELDRHDEPSPTRACVLVRLSHSHVRYGTFQRLASLRDRPRMEHLVDYVLQHLHSSFPAPVLPPGVADTTVARLLATTVARAADTAAAWMVAGFVHGVLNTDNMNITGESFDYGPWRFLPHFDNDFVAAYFDHGGLYAYGRQPGMVEWNLHQLAAALSLVAPPGTAADAAAVLAMFRPAYARALAARTVWRLGLLPRDPAADQALAAAFYRFLASAPIGFDQAFFDWYGGAASEARAAVCPDAARYAGPLFAAFYRLLSDYVPANPAALRHPAFQQDRPCSVLIGEVEQLWQQVSSHDRWDLLSEKVQQIRSWGSLLAGHTG